MVELQGQIVPTSEAEYRLLEALYEVTGQAHEDDVPPEEIVTTLNFVAASIMVYGDQNAEMPEVPDEPVEPEKVDECPSCGATIEGVSPFIGGDVEVEPCGCTVTVHQVPGWVDI